MVTDMSGRLVCNVLVSFSLKFSNTLRRLIVGLSSGKYFMQIQDENKINKI
jgi:hypothetical protein